MKNYIRNLEAVKAVPSRPSFWRLMKMVWLKLALNPNSYASIIGISWAFIANGWHFQMPSIMEDSGTGMAMFSMVENKMLWLRLFMTLQKKMITCDPGLTAFSMVLRFVAGPTAMAIGSIAAGLHLCGDYTCLNYTINLVFVFKNKIITITIIPMMIVQAALPQSITSFIFAREYGLHADVLSTAGAAVLVGVPHRCRIQDPTDERPE